MRIAVYKDTFAARRGADVAVQFLVDGLRARGHDVVAVTDADPDVRGRISGCDVCIAAGTNEMLALTDGGRNRLHRQRRLRKDTGPGGHAGSSGLCYQRTIRGNDTASQGE